MDSAQHNMSVNFSGVFKPYPDGFSPDIQEIPEKFRFINQIPTMIQSDILGQVIEKFTNTEINLSPAPVPDAKGNIRLPALDNLPAETERVGFKTNNDNPDEIFQPYRIRQPCTARLPHTCSGELMMHTYGCRNKLSSICAENRK